MRWRRPAAPAAAEADQLETFDEADPAATSDEFPAPKPSLLARITARLRRQPDMQSEAAEADQLETLDEVDPAATADEFPAPKPSLLARIKGRLRRQSDMGAEAAEDEATQDTGRHSGATTSGDEADDDELAAQPGLGQRVLATLTNKWVWIPGVSALLLIVMGAMMLMLLQSAQDKKHLQQELLATQKKLEQTAAKKAAPKHAVSADGTAVAAADGDHGGDGDCTVSDKESVIRNLKNCIDSFNQSQEAAAPAKTTRPTKTNVYF